MEFSPLPAHAFEDKKTAFARGLEIKKRVLIWTLKWGWVTERNLQKLLCVTRLPGHALVKRGLLSKNVSPTGKRIAYTINEEALDEAFQLYEEHDRCLALPYTWPQTQIPFAKLGAHQEYAQMAALHELYSKGGQLSVERELRLAQDGAMPDFVITRGSVIEWHEIELSAKYAERLYLQMQSRESARQKGEMTRIVWWCRGEAVAKVIRAAMSADRIPKTIRRPDGRVVRRQDEEGWNPKRLADVSEIRIMDKDGSYTLPSWAKEKLRQPVSEVDIRDL